MLWCLPAISSSRVAERSRNFSFAVQDLPSMLELDDRLGLADRGKLAVDVGRWPTSVR